MLCKFEYHKTFKQIFRDRLSKTFASGFPFSICFDFTHCRPNSSVLMLLAWFVGNDPNLVTHGKSQAKKKQIDNV